MESTKRRSIPKHKIKKVISTVPSSLRGPNNEWTAIAKRARVVFYNPKKVSPSEIKKSDLRRPG